MKKILSMFILSTMLMCALPSVTLAENDIQISGLDEIMDKVCLNSKDILDMIM